MSDIDFEEVIPEDEIDEGYFGEIIEEEYSDEGRCRKRLRHLRQLRAAFVATALVPLATWYAVDSVAASLLGSPLFCGLWFLAFMASICAAPTILGCLCYEAFRPDCDFWGWMAAGGPDRRRGPRGPRGPKPLPKRRPYWWPVPSSPRRN